MSASNQLISRGALDIWSEKRPGYAAGTIPEKECLDVQSATDNYYVSCGAIQEMPTFGDLTRINFAEVVVKNNGEYSKMIRVGFRVFGSSQDIAWKPYAEIGSGGSCMYVLEGLTLGVNYAVYVQESTNTQELFIFVAGQFSSSLTGYGYDDMVLITGSEQKSLKNVRVYVSSMKIRLRIYNEDLKPFTARVWNGSYDRTVVSTTDTTFEDVPFNSTFSITISGANASSGNEITIDPMVGNWESFDPLWVDNGGCEYEVNTGSSLMSDYYDVRVNIQ